MNKEIGLFAATLGTQAGGMETYELSLLRQLARIERSRPFTIYCLGEQARELIGIEQENVRYHVLPAGNRLKCMAVTLPAVLKKASCALVHPTYVPPLFCPKPYVYTVHSSVTWVKPHFYPTLVRWRVNLLQEKGIREARILLCVSEHVKDYMREHFRVSEDRLAVVYHGISDAFRSLEKAEVAAKLKEVFNLTFPYFLSVAKLKENKNISRLLQAHEVFIRETGMTDVKLVLAGRRLWTKGSLDRELDEAVATGRVVELGNVSHEHLPTLYNGSLGLVFASLWEGFGIPIIEAQACGTPVITSNNSSMPEAAGGHALLVDPTSAEEIAGAMAKLAGDEPLREKLSEGGLRHSSRFCWENTARQTLEAYDQALANT